MKELQEICKQWDDNTHINPKLEMHINRILYDGRIEEGNRKGIVYGNSYELPPFLRYCISQAYRKGYRDKAEEIAEVLKL